MVGHRPLTLQHGDLHPANAVVTKDGSGDGQSAALFDWAEINVSSGAAPTPPVILSPGDLTVGSSNRAGDVQGRRRWATS